MAKETDTITFQELKTQLYKLAYSSLPGNGGTPSVVTFHSAGTSGLVRQIFEGATAAPAYTREEIEKAWDDLGNLYLPSMGIAVLISRMKKNREEPAWLPERVYRNRNTGIYLQRSHKNEWQIFGTHATCHGDLYKIEDMELMP